VALNTEKKYDLLIVESPTKAKTIKKYLGAGFQVIASNGHIKDLPKSKLGVDVEDNFSLDIVPITSKKDKIQKIKEMAKGAKRILLAPDMDREGEAIAFHLAEELGNKIPMERVVFNAVTKNAILQAIENPRGLNHSMYDSQKTRRVLDRLVGYKISPILWEKVQRGISAGRVQSVALRLLVEREMEIKAFISQQWFSIEGFLSKEGVPFKIKYFGDSPTSKKELTEEKEAKSIQESTQKNPFKVLSVVTKERKQYPSPPFTTSRLQQEASYKLGFSASKTMMVAQKLYEGIEVENLGPQGLITYMRTDSVRIGPEALDQVRSHIVQRYGRDFLPETPVFYKKKSQAKVQDAHEAIRPTNLEFSPERLKKDLSSDEWRLYELIWNKFVSSQMSPAQLDQTSIVIQNGPHYFKTGGHVVKFLGFRAAYEDHKAEKDKTLKDDGAIEDQESSIPVLQEGETPLLQKPLEVIEHWTQPPPRFQDASLVKILEEKGIGRPSTYAAIISNLVERSYVDKVENKLIPTELGKVVCNLLLENFPDVMNVDFTAKIEETLDKIEEGEANWKEVLKDFWSSFSLSLDKAKLEMKNLKKQQIPTGISCQKCSEGEYHIRWGKNGQFLACSQYPECNSTQDFKQTSEGKIQIIERKFIEGKQCPLCQSRMILKEGKYGRFLACENYPSCKGTSPVTVDVTCPKCKVGVFAEKKSRYGKLFFGCTQYPECSNALWFRPNKTSCPACGYALMMEKVSKKTGNYLECPECKHKHHPLK